MIRRIQIDNFKSLDGFSLPLVGAPLANFTCLIGANGSGKTTVLQTIDFLSQLVKGRVPEWLRERGWLENDLPSQLEGAESEYTTISVEIKMASTLIRNSNPCEMVLSRQNFHPAYPWFRVRNPRPGCCAGFSSVRTRPQTVIGSKMNRETMPAPGV